MQTFLPYSTFYQIAECLDFQRHRKQIVEAETIINLLDGITDNSWKNHPACKMWTGYVDALKRYRNILLDDWLKNGNNWRNGFYNISDSFDSPVFLTDRRVILSHRSNLYRKNPEHYGKFEWVDLRPDIEGYYWPCEVKSQKNKKVKQTWHEIVHGTVN